MFTATTDRKTLAWIKEGVEETLRDIHFAPKKFAAFPDNTSTIKSCIDPLKRVRGAVEMVNIHGATLLAMELEYLVQAIIENRVTRNEDAAEVLATGMLQLPDYLENLYHGQPDIPLILLPVLNDLRAVQDKELLTESEFFTPDLNVKAPGQYYENSKISGDIESIAKKLRPGFLSGLLGIIRQENVTENVEKLILVIDNLLLASISDKSRQLWWITSGLVDAIYSGGLEASITVKILLARVDQEIQRVIVHGEESLNDNPPDKIIRSLLYYIAQSNKSSKRIHEIKKAFNLADIDFRTIERARKNLHGFDVNLVANFSAQIRDITGEIKYLLDHYSQDGEKASILKPVHDQLGTISNALEMLGIYQPIQQIIQHKKLLVQKVQHKHALQEDELMDIAATLLQIESCLADFGSSLSNQGGNNISHAEHLELLQLVSQEIISNIQSIKDHVGGFSSTRSNCNILTSVPGQLGHIAGVMRMLRHYKQARLTQAIADYVRKELIVEKPHASETSMDLLANAISGLENCYLTIIEESVAPEVGLVVANHSIRQLGYSPDKYTLA